MRLLLLVAALLGMLPQHAAMSHGGDHCMAPGPAASHAGAPMGQGPDGHDEDCPHWPQGSGYRILVEGEPHARIDYSVSSDRGDHNHAGCLATAMAVVNAIPAVVAAEPGVHTMLDLPVHTAAVRR